MINSKLNNIEAIGLLSIIMANKIILDLPELIISSTGSAAWLNTLFIILVSFVFIAIVLKLMNKFPGSDILDISHKVGGRFLEFIVGLLQIILLFFVAGSVLRGFSYMLKTIYFTQSPTIYIVSLMIIPIIIANKLGIKSISKICLYIIPVAYIGLVILLLAPANDFEIQRIFPILGYGFHTTFISGLSNLYALSGLGYIFLLPSTLNKNTNINKISLISLTLSSIALFFSIICMLLIFSFHINTNENMTLYLLTMVVHHGNIIHGINILFMIVWIISIMAYVSTTVYFIILILKKTFKIENKSKKYISVINYTLAILLLICSVIFQNYPIFFMTIQSIFTPAILYLIFIIDPLILILAYIKNNTKKILKKVCSFSIIIALLFSLTGCYDATGIEELAYVVALGLDLNDSNELELSVQIATSENKSSGDSSGSTSQSKSSNVTTIKCTSIDSGLSLINSHISKKLNLSHCQVILISEKLAKNGISSYMDTLLNNSELKNDCSVIVTKCNTKDYLNNVNPTLEDQTARFYESTLNSAKYSGYTVDITLFEFYSKMKSSCSQAYAILGDTIDNSNSQQIEENGNYVAGSNPIADTDLIDNLGIAVFKDDKLVGELTGLDSICHILVNNELKSCIISIPSPLDSSNTLDNYIDLNLTSEKKTNSQVYFENGNPYITVDVYLIAQGLSMNDNLDYDSVSQIHDIEVSSASYISKQITNYLYKTSKEFESDICEFGNYALKKYLTIDDWYASDWLNNYKNSTFDVNVHLKLKSGNLFDKT